MSPLAEESRSFSLDPTVLASIGSVELRARMVIEGIMQGMHRSPFQGVSIEFSQHRIYAPGDDTRFLDWKVFGKTDKLYLKQFERETNLDLVLLVDQSGSMAFSSRHAKQVNLSPPNDAQASDQPLALAPWSKFDCASTVTAALAYLCLKQQDRVGLWLMTDNAKQATRMSNATDHWRSIVNVLEKSHLEMQSLAEQLPKEQTSPPQETQEYDDALLRAVDQLTATLNNRSLIVIVSDFFDDLSAIEKALARLSNRRHDVMLLQVLDPLERTFAFMRPSDFLGLESEGRLPIDPIALRKAYKEVFEAHQASLQQSSLQLGFDHTVIDSSQNLGPALSHFLTRRNAAIARSR